MKLLPYSRNDAAEVRSVIADSINYAPEYIGENIQKEDLEYFDEVFGKESSGGLAYVVKQEGKIASFITCAGNMCINQKKRCYITGLFVKKNELINTIALASIELLLKHLSPDIIFCINVHPAAQAIRKFWESNGFILRPDLSIYTNSENEIISAYSPTLWS